MKWNTWLAIGIASGIMLVANFFMLVNDCHVIIDAIKYMTATILWLALCLYTLDHYMKSGGPQKNP